MTKLSAALPYGEKIENRLRGSALVFLCLIPVFLLFARGAADVALVLVAILFLVRSTLRRDWAWIREADIFALLVALLMLVVVVAPLAEFPSKSFTRGLIWVRFVVFYAAATRWVITDRSAVRTVCYAVTATLVLAAFDALYQFLSGASLLTGQLITESGRLTGPLDRPNIGSYLSKLAFGVMALAFVARQAFGDKRAFTLAALVMLPVLAVIFLSGERTASVLSLAGIAAVVIGLFLVGGRSRLLSIVIGVAGIAGIGLLLSLSSRIASRVTDLGTIISDYAASIYGQLALMGWRFFTEHPLTGIGMGSFERVCKAELPPESLEFGCYPHPHNIYMEWLSSSGLAGTLPWLVFVALVVWAGLRMIRVGKQQTVLVALYLATLNATLFPFAATQSAFSNWPAILAWMSIACAVAALRVFKDSEPLAR
ncbi:O-antigen ligase family protein [Thalassospira marina]|uniref:Polymerase n=1 Tax=Thalassospira marina TaxID=2048283 RepID=A0ABN5FIS6_9PROT|nr:O-antigen ligase family protein [Thalassospira marina]AUG54616.1 polymerase [Thalassospira marina]